MPIRPKIKSSESILYLYSSSLTRTQALFDGDLRLLGAWPFDGSGGAVLSVPALRGVFGELGYSIEDLPLELRDECHPLVKDALGDSTSV
jgi:hypothetical protein